MKRQFETAFTLEDANRAFDEWGANCGPGAVAGMLGRTLDEVKPHMGVFSKKRNYTNPKLMYDVLDSIGVKWKLKKQKDWPDYGLVRVQWHGPWTDLGAHWRARLRHSHWIGVMVSKAGAGVGVFDINCINNGTGWISLKDWEFLVVPWLLGEVEPEADGEWSITHSIELDSI